MEIGVVSYYDGYDNRSSSIHQCELRHSSISVPAFLCYNLVEMSGEIDLSNREQEILKMVATGASNKEIANKLVISPNTVKVHLRNIFAKIEVTSRTEATLYAFRHGLVQTPAADETGSFPEIVNHAEEFSTLAEGTPSHPAASTVGADGITPAAAEAAGARRYRFRLMILVGLVAVLIVALLALAAQDMRRQVPTAVQPDTAVTLLPITRWETRASLPVARSDLAAAAYEGQIYAIGGLFSDGVGGAVTRYNPDTNTWQALTPKPLAVAEAGAALLGEKFYIPGGQVNSGEVTDVLELYDPRRNVWDRKSPLPVGVSGYALAILEGKLYLFGGWDGHQPSSRVFSYDPGQDRWTEHSPLPSARVYAAAAAVGDKIYVVGGYDGKDALTVNEVYYPSRDNSGESPWEKRADLPEGRYHMGMAALADILYLVGGEAGPGQSMHIPFLEYVPTLDLWTGFETSTLPAPSGSAVLSLKNYIYVIGGRQENNLLSLLQAYHAIYTIEIPVIIH